MVSKKERCPTADRQRGYTFAYDGLSRLTQADYHEDNQRSNHYDTHYAYDLMGNITALQRSGLHDDGAYSLIDDLAFGYEGNRIVKVTDGVTDGPYRKDAWHYRDRVDADIEREYDGNGNLVKDLDAGILRIEYNSLNLPQMIKFSDHSKHVYAYDATGRKLRAEYHTPIMVVTEPQVPDMGEEMPEQEDVLMEEQQQEWNEEEWGEEWEMEEEELIPAEMPDENGEVVEEPLPQEENNCKPTIFFEDDDIACEVTTVDYCGDFIYVNGKLKRMLFPGGYVTFRNDSIECPEYHFYITDHQGNVRIVANQDGTIEQINHYYPYGGLMGESTNSDHQPYKYNGKELDRHHGLDWFDYGARWYNGYSWTTPDPLAEKYREVSPYMYCLGNPIKYIDPDGKKVLIWYVDRNGKNRNFIYDGTQRQVPNNSFVLDFVHTYNYMRYKNAGENLLKAVTDPNIFIEVQESSTSTKYDSSDCRHTIFWMPRKGIITTEGGRQSPATALEHEFDHAIDDIKDHKKHRDRREIPDSQYDNAEERRVITGSEKKTAKKLGESIRKNHKGTTYEVIDPRTTKEKVQ